MFVVGYSSKYLMVLIEIENKFGFVFVETTTHEFFFGEFEDDINRTNLRTLTYRTKPLEIIYIKNFVTQTTLNLLRYAAQKP